MDGGYGDTIRNSLNHIESKLPEHLNIGGLAGGAFFSKARFQQLFREIMGEPVMEYVKRRRLLRACAALADTDESVLNVALRFGYESHEGFTRAFKAYFGVPPSRYRKNIKSVRERKIMLSNALTKNIGRHMGTITECLQAAKNELEIITASAERAAGLAGTPRNGTILVLISEWKNIAGKISAISEISGAFLKGGPTVYDLTDKVYGLLKNLDETSFQMNILSCFSNIETARMGGREKEIFSEVNERFAVLRDTVVNNRKDAEAVIESLAAMIKDEIKDEAGSRIKSISALLNAAAGEGDRLAFEAREVEDAWSGVGIIGRLKNEIIKRTEAVRKIGVPDAEALNKLETYAFHMNIATFNASVEAARSGPEGGEHDRGVYKLARGIREYAERLNRVYSECAALYDEYEKLTGLLRETPKTERETGDIVLQCEILGTLLGIEADRFMKNENFRGLAEKVLSAAETLTEGGTESLERARDEISSAAKECEREAKAIGRQGAAFEYISAELWRLRFGRVPITHAAILMADFPSSFVSFS